jgi:cytochrome c biogenesis protein CcmG, thiol:disulfide interchange protein DsbE
MANTDDTSPRNRMTPRRASVTLACLAIAVLIAVGIAELPRGASSGVPTTARLTAAQTNALLAGSPPALAALHAQAGALLVGGSRALRARLAALKGYPIVINKWASWCAPCRAEFGALQRASADYGRRVAFLGIDSGDSGRAEAAAFLKSFPVSYPSYYDQSGQLGEQVTYSSFTPVTVFIPRDGKPYIHQGQYPSVAKLEQDVRRYALNA